MSRPQSSSGVRQIALERIEILLKLARTELSRNPERARRYVRLARRFGTRYRVRPAKELKISYCKKCNTPWVLGCNLEVRLEPRSRCVVYKCSCGYERRFRYKR